MQITPVPVPVTQTAPQLDVVANAVHNIQVQSTAPITQNAVAPTPKKERSDKSKERRKEGREPTHDDQARPRGGNVNISV
ncbi:MAG TPA: hypothetical protein DD400_04130 [Rhodospirillaceae bacterium]|nr:hypothetical protein [Rhodospirillaceae bacterium]